MGAVMEFCITKQLSVLLADEKGMSGSSRSILEHWHSQCARPCCWKKPLWGFMEWLTKWLLKSYDFTFGCRHRDLTRVFTIEGRTYRVCCSCGLEFNYSLENMSVVPYARTPFPSVTLASRIRPGAATGEAEVACLANLNASIAAE